MINATHPDILNVEQIAEYLGVTRRAAYTLRHRDQFPPAFHVGRELRWRRVDVDRWIETRTAA